MKIILIVLAILITTSLKSFSLDYSKTVNTEIIFQDGSKEGRTENEGFYGANFDFFPICKKMNINAKGLRQGKRVFYKSDGSIRSENGIYDCQYGFGKVVFGLVEGINDGASGTFIYFKTDAKTKYFYRKINNIWYAETMLADFFLPEDPKSNHTQRAATTQEINHAERLYKFYKEIDLSSPKAKKYNIINTSINLVENIQTNKTQEQSPAKKQKDIQQKRELDSAKIKEEQIKLSKMKPEDRHAYTCTEKFGFRKGSDKFKDCVFELYKVETELEKIELQKKIVEANLEVAKMKESSARTEQDRNTALLERQTLAQERAAAAAAQQARIANFESNQRLFDRSMELLSGDRNLAGQVRQPQQRLKATCTYTGGFMNCF